MTVPGVDVALRRDAVDGPLLTTLSITDPIVPGAYRDVSWVWQDVAPIPGGVIEVFAVADEADTVDEFNEDNNVRSALVTNQPSTHPGDWAQDGDVDLTDYAEFAGCLSGPWEGPGFVLPSGDCLEAFDFDADADVDARDYGAFQAAFTG